MLDLIFSSIQIKNTIEYRFEKGLHLLIATALKLVLSWQQIRA